MECPHCTAELPDDDLFCEECGKPLGDDLEDPEDLRTPRCTCGAPVADADDEGFCGTCGRRVRPRETDHIEAALSPDLAAVSDKGQRHDRNEDRFALRQSEEATVMVVCDGVSNSRESELASSLAAETIADNVMKGMSLGEAMREAAAAVAKLGLPGMDDAPSTTAVAAQVKGTEATVAWAGDSRAYWISSDCISSSDPAPAPGSFQLTVDHSWMNAVVSTGEMTWEEAAGAPRAHAITRWFGADLREDLAAEVATFQIGGPGWLVLCSDGLWNYAPALGDMERLVNEPGETASALEICRALVEFANKHGGQDNITAALLRLERKI